MFSRKAKGDTMSDPDGEGGPQDAHALPVAGTRIPCFVFDSDQSVSRHAARLIADTIRQRDSAGARTVLGLTTDDALIGVVRELGRLRREGHLDPSRVKAFLVDEYFGLAQPQRQSRSGWLVDGLVKHLAIPRRNVGILDPAAQGDAVEQVCRRFEDEIREAGGIDVQLLTIGRNGRIAFNEPFSIRRSRTRLVTLDPVTRADAAADFSSHEQAPTHALTAGVATLLEARRVLLIGYGEHRASIVREAAEGVVTDRVPASFLQDHPQACLVVDTAAAAELTALATPWVLGSIEWTEPLVKRAALWLCEKTGKALLKLDDDDFRNHNLHRLLRHHGPAQRLAHRVFKWMMDTIDYHPAGREPGRVLCFSPHPDDDVISMGGTMIRLLEDGHEVHVAYMTSGNIAVFDHDVQQLADLMTELNRRFGIDVEKTPGLEQRVLKALAEKRPGEPDAEDVLRFKALIRWSEAKSAATACGCREEDLHFLDLPFYRTGTIDKNEPGADDVGMVRALIETVSPRQVYVAGDLTDPHGTHRVCAWIIFRALAELGQSRGARPEVLLYRGAWQEWPLHRIEVAVPLSPSDVRRKRQAIFRHESQKDTALFPGPDDPREFWQRAEDRNRHTADLYNRIGLPEYYAMEAFVRADAGSVGPAPFDQSRPPG